jgi:hypothetical protein
MLRFIYKINLLHIFYKKNRYKCVYFLFFYYYYYILAKKKKKNLILLVITLKIILYILKINFMYIINIHNFEI